MQNAHTAHIPQDAELEVPFDARFRDLLAEITEQDETVLALLEAQGLDRAELDTMAQLPDSIAQQLDDAADERIEAWSRERARPRAAALSIYALRA